MHDWLTQNITIILDIVKDLGIASFICFSSKIVKYIFGRNYWNKKFDSWVLIIAFIITVALGILYAFLKYKSEVSIEIAAMREIGMQNNEKKYQECNDTKIYLDGEFKGKTPKKIETNLGKHWLHLRYEGNPFYKEYGPEIEIFRKKDENQLLKKKIDKKVGLLNIHVPNEAMGNAEFTIKGEGLEIKKTRNMFFTSIPFGHYEITGKWRKRINVSYIVVINDGNNSTFLFKD